MISRIRKILWTNNISHSLHLWTNLINGIGSINFFVHLASIEAVYILATSILGRQSIFHFLSFKLVIWECRIDSILRRADIMLLSIGWIFSVWLWWLNFFIQVRRSALGTYAKIWVLQSDTLFEILKVLLIKSVEWHNLQFIDVSREFLGWRGVAFFSWRSLIFWNTLHLPHKIFNRLPLPNIMRTRSETVASLRKALALFLFILGLL